MSHAPLCVVVAYGRADLLASCLAALTGADMVVVDNSRSPEVERVAREAAARYVAPERNLGFAGGVNVGIAQRLPGQDVLLVNTDAQLNAPDRERLVGRLRAGQGRVAAVAPVLRRPDGSLERTRWPLPSPLVVWAGIVGLADRVARSFFVSGAVLLLDGRALDELGGFDERFFMYAEEADWQRRAQEAGWRVEVCETAVAVHVGGASNTNSALREILFHSSAELYARKWFGGAGWWAFRAGALLAALRRLAFARRGEPRRAAALVARLYLRGPAHALPEAMQALT